MSMQTPTVFKQLFQLTRNHIPKLVGQLDKYSKRMNTTQLTKILLYAQITGKDSLRDIETGLQANQNELYHLGIDSYARSTIAYWNNKVDSKVYEEMFYNMLQHYKSSCIAIKGELWISTIATDSTLISLALGQFDRALHRTTKWGIRAHVWLELDTCLPRFVVIKDAKQGDNVIAREVIKEWKLYKWEMIVFDRYYVDFSLWREIDESWSFFVSRSKNNTLYTVYEDHNVLESWIIQDATIELTWTKWVKEYRKPLRLVRYYDKEGEREFTYITNNFDLPASKIALIYKNRRKIEDFFRWIKQNLKINSFLWTSKNAVMNQLRVAMIYYLILQYLRNTARFWTKQILKLARLLREKCMRHFPVSEIYSMCRSRTTMCMITASGPPGSLFEF